MTPPLFKELFDYSHHCNQQLAEQFLQHPEAVSDKALQLMSHVLNAHHIWNNRIDKRSEETFKVWQLHNPEAFKPLAETNYQHTLAILNEKDLEQEISYVNSKGEAFKNTARDILFHVVNHTTYHRGQIATEFKNQGVAPLVSDYIFYKR